MRRLQAVSVILLLAAGVPAAEAGIAYHVVDLGSLGGGASIAWGINDAGQVVGASATTTPGAPPAGVPYTTIRCGPGEMVPTTAVHAFLYDGGAMLDLGTLGGKNSVAFGVNRGGDVVGFINTPADVQRAFLYTGGTMLDLGVDNSYAMFVNTGGQVTGYVSGAIDHPFRYDAGVFTALPTLPGGGYAYPFGMDDAGRIIGWGDGGGYQRAILWDAGPAIDLFPDAVGSHGDALAPGGRAVVDLYDGQSNGYYRLDGTTLTPLALPADGLIVRGMNDAGTFVGENQSTGRGFVYDGAYAELTKRIIPAPPFVVTLANGINAGGQITGCASDGTHAHAIRLDPFDPALCGNAFLDPGEECDDGNTASGDDCDATCLVETPCGDGIRQPHEECDDGNVIDGDGCDHNCRLTRCGNGAVSPGEQCDDGNLVSGDGCDADCTPTGCGNGIVTTGESCDDGNTVSGDGCSPACTVELCGDGIITPNEECDDGNTNAGDGCSPTCQLENEGLCGNGVVDPGETCDDSNRIAGDNCSPTCQFEGFPDIRGGWQVAANYGAGLSTKFILITDEDFTTGQFHAVPGFSCGTDDIAGFIYANATCTFTPTTITGRLLSPTRFALPETGSYTVDSTRADPADFGSCNPLTRTRIDFALSGQLRFAPDGRVDQITGLVASQDLTLFSGSAVCLEVNIGASLDMRPNDVPVGTNVVTTPSTNASVMFETVATAGAAGVIPISTPTGTLPPGFQLTAGAPYTDVVTTAGVSGTITTCLPYPDTNDDGFVDGTQPPIPEGELQILHEENGTFVDRTVSRDPIGNFICAVTSSLSEFAVGTGPTVTTTTTASTSTTSTTIPLCDPEPRTSCKHPIAPLKSTLQVKTPVNGKGKVTWKWVDGADTALAEFGVPDLTDGYALCIYDSGLPPNRLLVARPPIVGTCHFRNCWQPKSNVGWQYSDPAAAHDGLKSIKLKAGVGGKAQVRVGGKGPALPLAAFTSLPVPLIVQLQSTRGVCFEADFDQGGVRKNVVGTFVGKGN